MTTRTDILRVKFEVDGDGQVKVSLAGVGNAADNAGKKLDGMEKRASAAGKALGLALAAGATAAVAIVKSAIDNADRLNDLSERLGVSASKLSAWGYAAKQSGSNLETLNGGLRLLAKNMADALDADSRSAKLFDALGIKVTDAAGEVRSLEQIVPELATAFKNLNDPVLESALSMQLLGRSGTELLQFFNEGADGLQTLEDRARSLGIVISDETAAAAAEFNDRLDDLQAAGMGLATQLAAELLPQLTELVAWATEFVTDGGNAANVAEEIAGAFDVLATGAGLVWKVMETVGATVRGLTSEMIALANASRAAWNVLTLDFDEAGESWRNAGVAQGMANEQRQRIGEIWTGGPEGAAPTKAKPKAGNTTSRTTTETRGTGAFANVMGSEESQQLERMRKAAETAKRLREALAGEEDPKPKAKRASAARERKPRETDEQRDAKELQRSYEQLMEQQREQIALFGETGEAARVRYDTEFGSLKNLDQAKKEELIANAERLDAMGAEAEVAANIKQANEQREDAAKQIITDLQDEAAGLWMSAEAQEVYNNQKWAGVKANTALGDAIAKATKEAQQARQAREVLEEFGDVAQNSLEILLDYTRSGEEAFASFVDGIRQMMIRLISEALMKKLLDMLMGDDDSSGGKFNKGGGSSGGGGGWGGLLQAILGAFGGGRASGGPVSGNSFYEVGEGNRPELLHSQGRTYLIPGNDGNVAPMGGGAGGGGQQEQKVTVIAVFGEDQLNSVIDKRAKSPQGERIAVTHFQRNRRQMG